MALNDIKVPRENAQGTFDELVLTPASLGAAPATHASTHHTGGADAIAPSSIGAQTLFTTTTLNLNSDTTLTAARATNYLVVNSGNHTITLPTTGHLVGDIVVVRYTAGTGTLNVTWGAGGQTVVLGAQYRFIATGTGATNWALVNVDTHTHTFGTTAGTFTEGNDARLSDSRTPTAHAASHATGGSDPLAPSDIGAAASNHTHTLATDIATALAEDPDLCRDSLNLGDMATEPSSNFSTVSHGHGNLTSDGKLGSTAGLPVVTTTAGAVTTLALGTANQILRVNSGATSVEFADPAASGVTGAAASASDVLGVSGANITGVDATADRIVFWDDSASALKHLTVGSGLSLTDTTLTATGGGVTTGSVDNAILRADGTGGSTSQSSRILVNDEVVSFSCTASASTDIITAVGHNFTTNQGVRFLSLTGGGGLNTTTNYFVRDISGDTFKVSTSSGGSAVNITTDITAGSIVATERHVAIVNNATEANSSLVLLTKGNGSFIVSNTIPDGANGGGYRGTNTIEIRAGSTTAAFVASGESSVLVGAGRASGSSSIAIGLNADATQPSAIAIGNSADAVGDSSVAIGRDCGGLSLALNAVIIAPNQINPLINQRGSFTTRTFGSVRWSGTTTNNTATELFLDGASPNRCVIPASSSFIFDILISASGNSKYLMARRFLGIRRDGSNNTALVGTVQTIGTDQSEGSPTWTFSFTADDSNESLKCEVTGATSETVTWTICAFLR